MWHVWGKRHKYIQSFGWGGPEEKRALGRPRHIWKDNIKMDLKEIGWEGVNSIQLA